MYQTDEQLVGENTTIKLVKDKETKTKIRYAVTGDVSGSIYVDKDSDLAKESEIILEIAQATA